MITEIIVYLNKIKFLENYLTFNKTFSIIYIK